MTNETMHHVGIGELIFSSNPDDLLVARSLGSCLGVAVFDSKLKEGGMIHCLLPISKSDPEKAARQPELYVDTGVAKLLDHFFSRGASPRDLVITVAGGSNINDANNIFEIGRKNYTILRKLLWKNNLLIHGEDVGGSCSRTITLCVRNGEVWVKSTDTKVQLSGGVA